MSIKRSGALVALAVLVAVVVAACGSGQQQNPATTSSAATSSTPTQAQTPATTATAGTGTARPAEGDHNDADVLFAQMMIPHHAQAIEMSDLLLAKDGVDDRVAALAQQIKAAQGPEIEQMTGWLQAWDADVPSTSAMPGMGHGSGMMGEHEMQALADADGAAAATLFLEQMIMHHNGAIQMAQTEVAQGQNAEATALAQSIIDSQQAEVTEMQSLLTSL